MTIKEIESEILNCHRCRLIDLEVNRSLRPLPGRWQPGTSRTNLETGMIVGMNPNVRRDLGAIPFGSSAAIRWLKMINQTVSLSEWWITNLVKCSTETNELGSLDIASCRWWLQREIDLVRPALIIASGVDAAKDLGVETQGSRWKLQGTSLDQRIPIIGLYHFAYSIRFGKMESQRKTLIRLMDQEGLGRYLRS